MNVEINILGTTEAMNTWTFGRATVNSKIYKIQMVRFDEPSQYGIRKGRISKLYIADADRNMVANFDRGWDVRPNTAEAKAIVNGLIKKFN